VQWFLSIGSHWCIAYRSESLVLYSRSHVAGLLKLHVPCLLYDDVCVCSFYRHQRACTKCSHWQEASCLLDSRTANSRHWVKEKLSFFFTYYNPNIKPHVGLILIIHKLLFSTPHLCSCIMTTNHICSVIRLLCCSYMAPARGTVQLQQVLI
jgi:hypothetical protein